MVHTLEEPVREAIRAAIGPADEISEIKKRIERWFNDAMDRASGWYKRRVQIILLFIALFVVGALKADTIEMVRTLSMDPQLRAAVVSSAAQHAAAHASEDAVAGYAPGPDEALGDVNRLLDEIDAARFPLGWSRTSLGLASRNPMDPWSADDTGTVLWNILIRIPGLLLTALAIMLGAPFWFDVLNKVNQSQPASNSQPAPPWASGLRIARGLGLITLRAQH